MRNFHGKTLTLLLVLVLAGGLSWSCAVSDKARDKPARRPYFLLVLTSAAHLDYSDAHALVRSLYKQRRFKGGFAGHSWIYLGGEKDGRTQALEVGLSQPADEADMFEGVLNLNDYGYVHPTEAQKLRPRFEPNPIRRLWDDWNTGLRLAGKQGRTHPTYAALAFIDRHVYERILEYADPDNYDFKSFSLAGRQCTTFAVGAAALAGLNLESRVDIHVPPVVRFGGKTVRLWTDKKYSTLTVSSPDRLEQSLKQAVREGRAEYGLDFYRDLVGDRR
ncbi:MAG: hypothetical protein V1816_20595 [Pseudomonadota bacterium]